MVPAVPPAPSGTSRAERDRTVRAMKVTSSEQLFETQLHLPTGCGNSSRTRPLNRIDILEKVLVDVVGRLSNPYWLRRFWHRRGLRDSYRACQARNQAWQSLRVILVDTGVFVSAADRSNHRMDAAQTSFGRTLNGSFRPLLSQRQRGSLKIGSGRGPKLAFCNSAR